MPGASGGKCENHLITTRDHHTCVTYWTASLHIQSDDVHGCAQVYLSKLGRNKQAKCLQQAYNIYYKINNCAGNLTFQYRHASHHITRAFNAVTKAITAQ